MIFFTVNKSAGYGARIFIQKYIDVNTTNEVIGLHELAKELSVWKGADKKVIFQAQDTRAPNKTGNRTGILLTSEAVFDGYEVEDDELNVLVKRCARRGLRDVTPILADIKQEWV